MWIIQRKRRKKQLIVNSENTRLQGLVFFYTRFPFILLFPVKKIVYLLYQPHMYEVNS